LIELPVMARQEINPGYTMVREMALEANAVEGASSCVGNGKWLPLNALSVGLCVPGLNTLEAYLLRLYQTFDECGIRPQTHHL